MFFNLAVFYPFNIRGFASTGLEFLIVIVYRFTKFTLNRIYWVTSKKGDPFQLPSTITQLKNSIIQMLRIKIILVLFQKSF